MPTRRQTRAVAELLEHLTATATVFPGTRLRVLRYASNGTKRTAHPAQAAPCRESWYLTPGGMGAPVSITRSINAELRLSVATFGPWGQCNPFH